MKKLLCLSICLFFISCGLTDVPSDPDGTMTVNLSTTGDWIIYQGIPDKIYSFVEDYNMHATVYYRSITIGLGITSNLNTRLTATSFADNFHASISSSGGEIANIGICEGIGDVTTKPSSGYSNICSIQLNHGYVLRFRKYYDQADAALPYTYVRFYVVNWLTESITHGVIGATVKIQLSF